MFLNGRYPYERGLLLCLVCVYKIRRSEYSFHYKVVQYENVGMVSCLGELIKDVETGNGDVRVKICSLWYAKG